MIRIPDAVSQVSLGIEGLAFESNNVRHLDQDADWFSVKLLSSPGPLISDFVTHESDFKYTTYGIHVGQDDRLTFLGGRAGLIEGHFVDCREGSPSLHQKVAISFSPAIDRRLIIPRGVAHTFDGLQHVVTRDEPVWYSDDANEDWNLDNDLVSVTRDTEPSSFPVIRANRFRLPDSAHVFLSRLSQSLLETPRAYLSRYKLTVAGREQYVMFEPTSWALDREEVVRMSDVNVPQGIRIERNRYAFTGPRSWTVIPNTESCVADILLLPKSYELTTPLKYVHNLTRKRYTFFPVGKQIALIKTLSQSGKGECETEQALRLECDPRVQIVIEPGVPYSIQSSQDLLVRCEHELFISADEAHEDILNIGKDLNVYIDGVGIHKVPSRLKCPGSVVRLAASNEVRVHESMSA